MAKSFLYALVAVILVFIVNKVMLMFVPTLGDSLEGIIWFVIQAAVSGFVGFKAMVMLNKNQGKSAPSAMFFGLLAYILCIVVYSAERSIGSDRLNVTLITLDSLGLWVGALIAGKKTA